MTISALMEATSSTTFPPCSQCPQPRPPQPALPLPMEVAKVDLSPEGNVAVLG